MDETERMLELLNSSFPDITRLPHAQARAAVDGRIRPTVAVAGVSSGDVSISVSGASIRARVYRAETPIPDLPITVFAHGGGFVHGRIEGHDAFCREWVLSTGGCLVSVDYRLAPEHIAPTATEDFASAVLWADRHRVELDPVSRGITVAGDSAGGMIAAVVARMLRDRGGIDLRAQVLLYPMIDPDRTSESHLRNAEGAFVTSKMIAWYWNAYLDGASTAVRDSKDVQPLRSELAGLAPAIVVVAGRDPLCDEGDHYARALHAAGVTVRTRHYANQFHGFATIPGYGPGQAARKQLFDDLTGLLEESNERKENP